MKFAKRLYFSLLGCFLCSINLAMASSSVVLPGEIVLLSKTVDVTGDAKADQIYLIGKQKQAGSLIQDINVVVTNGATQENSRSLLSGVSGYRPTLEVGQFTKNKSADVMFTLQTADLATLVYIIDFQQQPPQVIFQTPAASNEPALRQGQVAITPADDNTTVQVKLGSSLNLELPENPSTGYTWQFVQSSGGECVTFLGEQNLVPENTPAMAGKPSLKVFAFQTKQAGTVAMELAEYRVWEGADSAVNHFKVTVNIVK